MSSEKAMKAAGEAFLRSKLENKGDHAWMQVALAAAIEAATPVIVADAKAEALEEAANECDRTASYIMKHNNSLNPSWDGMADGWRNASTRFHIQAMNLRTRP